MLDRVKVSIVQFEPANFREKKKNFNIIIGNIEKYGKDRDLIVFPELSLNNFFELGNNNKEEYYKQSESLNSVYIKEIIKLAQKNNLSIVFGISEKSDKVGYLYNSALLITPEGQLNVQRKIHLPGQEKFFYIPGREIKIFNTKLGKIGLCICYDIFFPELIRILALRGAEIIIGLCSVWKGGNKGGIGSGSSQLAKSKEQLFDLVPTAHAMSNQVFFLKANACGKWYGGEEIGYWERIGKSKIIDPFGQILAEAKSQACVIHAELEKEVLLKNRAGYNFFIDRRPEMYKDIMNS